MAVPVPREVPEAAPVLQVEPPVVAVAQRAAVELPAAGPGLGVARQVLVAGERAVPAYHPEDHRPLPAVCLPAATLAAVTLVAVTRQKD